MGEVVPLPRPDIAIDLDENDVSEIIQYANSLSGKWG